MTEVMQDLLIDFDEMGFAPTTLCPNPDKYACEWKKKLVAEINCLQEEINALKTKCFCISNDRDRIKKFLKIVSTDLQEGTKRLTEAERKKFWAMTDEEIREFWEQLSDYTVAENVNRVIPAKMFSKLGHVSKSTIDIIKRLNAENDDLTERLNATIAGQETLQKALSEKDREFSVLNSDLKLLRNDYYYLKEKFDKAIEKNIKQRDKIVRLISEQNSAEAIRAEAIREFSKAVIDGVDEGYISHSSDIAVFTTDYLRSK